MNREMHGSRGWPKAYGFRIYGKGPTYVTDVERGGVADRAGLKAGDMLLEVDGHNVIDMSADAITTLANHSKSSPPTLGVVSRVKVVDLIANKKWGYGFTVRGRHPVKVESVDPPGPAYQAGIRPGDLILKVNGVEVTSDALVSHVLAAGVGRLTLSLVPIDAPGSVPYVGPWLECSEPSSGPSVAEGMGPVRRAKDLCQKLHAVLGQSFDKKMAVIGLLKQYAEDRDIEGLVQALSELLKTDQERALIPALRSLVPVQHKTWFDQIITTTDNDSNYEVSNSKLTSTTDGYCTNGKYNTNSRFIRVKRGRGSFGFILKGHSPVIVESTVPTGPADRAGICPGDAIVSVNGLDVRNCTHFKLVELLRGSGSSPTLEVMRMEKKSSTSVSDNDSPLFDSEPESADEQTDTLTEPSPSLDLKGGGSLSAHVHQLLTDRESMAAVSALQNYKKNGRIQDLMTSLKGVLDTGSKRTLWYHIIPRLPWHHRVQVLKSARTLGLQPKELQKYMKGARHVDHVINDTEEPDVSVGSFKKQLDYLLTSSERSQLKMALEEYIRSKDVHHLVFSLEQIFDTPSKRTLFFYVIPLLNTKHQEICRTILGLPKHYTEAGRKERDRRKGLPRHSHRSEMTDDSDRELSPSSNEDQDDEDDEDRFSRRDTLPVRDTRRHDILLDRRNVEPEAADRRDRSSASDGGAKPKGKVRIVKESGSQTTPVDTPSHRAITNYKTVIQVLESPTWPATGQAQQLQQQQQQQQQQQPQQRPLLTGHGKLHGVTITRPYQNSPNPAGTYQPEGDGGRFQVIGTKSTTNGQSDVRHVENIALGSSNQHEVRSKRGNASTNETAATSRAADQRQNVDVRGKLIHWPPRRNTPNGFSNSGADSGHSRHSDDASLDSFQRKALNAIHALDEVVAKEQALPVSHVDKDDGWKGVGIRLSPDAKVQSPVAGKQATTSSPPPAQPVLKQAPLQPSRTPIPPAPPLPPGSTPPPVSDSVKMHVKRINWEKLDKVPEDSIWAKLNIGDDLKELIEHLQLEKQFTTKRSKIADSFGERKAEMGILNPKKAYNISILLGHMKMPVDDIIDALLAVDDVILTSDLLRHLLTFAPDEEEMASYNSFSGNLEDLSKPDQFMYQITRVPNFHARLKSMLFKASFHEKVDEIKQRLDNLSKASEELQESKSLAKLLELVLAMGNQMNKGDSRVGSAAGFRLSCLTQLDMMKTSSGKESFMNVLADVIQARFPAVIQVAAELPTLPTALRDAEVCPDEEIVEIKRMLGEIKAALSDLPDKPGLKQTDKLPAVMNAFLNEATKEINDLNEIEKITSEKCKQMIKYFGEDPSKVTVHDIFSTFLEFIHKLEKAYHQNLMKRT